MSSLVILTASVVEIEISCGKDRQTDNQR